MDEPRVNFLIKAAAIISQNKSNVTQHILQSYYLLRCNKVAGNLTRLPKKHFSKEKRCLHCLIEWKKETNRKLKPIKLSKKQRRRLRCQDKVKETPVNKEHLISSNEMASICTFCGHITKEAVLKPTSFKKPPLKETEAVETNIIKPLRKPDIKQNNVKVQSNVYTPSNVAFSLKKENTIANLVKTSPKVIKNNKKKKDKFAGLCQAAVIAASKLKHQKESHNNKLNLFLRPSV